MQSLARSFITTKDCCHSARTLGTASFLLLFLLWPDIASAQFSGAGSGTAADPYIITTAAQLDEVRNDLTAHYQLGANIDLSGYGSWDPIGDNNAFTGHFDGKEYTISNFTINQPSSANIGLFSENEGTIENLTLASVDVTGDYNVGGLVGLVKSGGEVRQSHASGQVTAGSDVGGLIGVVESGGVVRQSHASGQVTADYNVGGLVGLVESGGEVRQSHASGQVTADYDVGGLIGTNEGNVSSSYATAEINGEHSRSGGLIGSNSGQVTESFATGDVNGWFYAGGLIGNNEGTVSHVYAAGDAHANGEAVFQDVEYAGGLIGLNKGAGAVNYAYAIGTVTGRASKPELVGGLIGGNENTADAITASYWDINTSGQSDSDGGEGKTTSEMSDRAIYDAAGWDSAVWDWIDGRYPKLQAIAYDDSFDMAAPSAPAANISGGTYNTDQTIALNGESGASIYYTLDGSIPTTASIAYSAPITVSSTTTLKAIAVDAAGNVSGVLTESYTIDKTTPTGSLAINGGNATTKNTDVTLSITQSGGSEMRFSNDNNSWTSWEPVAANKTWTLSSGDGSKTVYMQLRDAAGNISGSISDSIILDTKVPLVTDINDGDVVIGEVVITFSEGTATLNGSPFTSGSTVSTEGDYTLIITDAAGNETAISFTILPENRQPTITSTPVQLVRMEQAYSYTVEAEDPDTDNRVSFTAALSGGEALPGWLEFTDNGDNTAVFSGTPEEADIGNYEIAVVAADDGIPQEESTQEFTLQVKYREVTELKALYNYPNPFRSTTKIKFELPEEDEVYLQIYNTAGALIRETAPQVFQAGANEYDFYAYNLSSGIYIYRIVSSGDAVTGRLVLTR